MAAIRNSLLKSNLPWLLAVIAAGAATRVPHLAALASPSHDLAVTYQPTLASTRFLECAREMLSGGVESDAFSFASPCTSLPGPDAEALPGPVGGLSCSKSGRMLTERWCTPAGEGRSSRPQPWHRLSSGFIRPAAFFEGALLPVSLLALL